MSVRQNQPPGAPITPGDWADSSRENHTRVRRYLVPSTLSRSGLQPPSQSMDCWKTLTTRPTLPAGLPAAEILGSPHRETWLPRRAWFVGGQTLFLDLCKGSARCFELRF